MEKSCPSDGVDPKTDHPQSCYCSKKHAFDEVSSDNDFPELQQYTSLMESGFTNCQAYRVAFMGHTIKEVEALPDPGIPPERNPSDDVQNKDALYCQLLENGRDPLDAFGQAYEVSGKSVKSMAGCATRGSLTRLTGQDPKILDEEGVGGAGDATNGISQAGDPYYSRIYKLTHSYLGNNYDTYLRINIPEDYADYDGSNIGIVVFVNGAGGDGVTPAEGDGDNDILAGYLAAKTDLLDPTTTNTFGRPASDVSAASGLLITVAFNLPGYGEGAYVATGAPYFNAHPSPSNQTGADHHGTLSLRTMDAVVCAARTIVEALFSDVNTRYFIIIHSFSCGVITASRWIAEQADEWRSGLPVLPWPGQGPFGEKPVEGTDYHKVHAFIESEGPMDSTEITASTYCFSYFSYGMLGEPTVTKSDWEADPYTPWWNCYTNYLAANNTGDKFKTGWNDYYVPPYEVAEYLYSQWVAAKADGIVRETLVSAFGRIPTDCQVTNPQSAGYTTDLEYWGFWQEYRRSMNEGFFKKIMAFWEERKAENYIKSMFTDIIYVRINMQEDHVQPGWYINRHAARAVYAAYSVAGIEKTYLADYDYYNNNINNALTEPTSASVYSTIDIEDWATFPRWPDGSVPRWVVEGDALRWAFIKLCAS